MQAKVEFKGYVVTDTHFGETEKCVCLDCGWTGKKSKLLAIGSCELTPGDISPAGRCPQCNELSYPDDQNTRISQYGEELLHLVKEFVSIQQGMASGKPMKKDALETLLKRGESALKEIGAKRRKRAKTNE